MTVASLSTENLAPWAALALPLLGATRAAAQWDGQTAVLRDGDRAGNGGITPETWSSWSQRPLQVNGEVRGTLWIDAYELPAAEVFDRAASLLAHQLATASQREAALAEVQHIKQATEAANVGLWDWEPATGLSRSGNYWPQLFGYAPGEIAVSYDGWAALVHPDDLEPAKCRLEDFLDASDASQLRLEYRMRHRDGHWKWALSLANVVSRRADGRPLLVAGTHQDMHLEKTAEIAAVESERYARALFDCSPDCIKVISLDGRVLDLSHSGVDLLGLATRDEMVGESWPALWDEPYRQRVFDALAAAGGGATTRFRGYLPIRGDEPRWWDVFVAPLRNADGGIDRTLVTSRDISAQVRSEDALHDVTAHVQAQVVKRVIGLARVCKASRAGSTCSRRKHGKS